MSEAYHIRSTFKHALIYSGASILSKAIGFIMLPVYAFYLRGDGYGIIGMIDVLLSVLSYLFGLGIAVTMRRFYFEKITEQDKHVFVSTNITLMFLLVIVTTVPAVFFSEQIARLAFGKIGMGYYVTLAMFTFIADVTSRNAENYILIRQESLFYTGLALLRLFLGLSLNIYLIVYLAQVLGFSPQWTYNSDGLQFHPSWLCISYEGFAFRASDVERFLLTNLPMMPGLLALFFRINTDRIMLGTYLGLTQFGAFEMLLNSSPSSVF